MLVKLFEVFILLPISHEHVILKSVLRYKMQNHMIVAICTVCSIFFLPLEFEIYFVKILLG